MTLLVGLMQLTIIKQLPLHHLSITARICLPTPYPYVYCNTMLTFRTTILCVCLEYCTGHCVSESLYTSSPILEHSLTQFLLQDIDEKAEEAYKKMEDAFRVQLGLTPEAVTAS